VYYFQAEFQENHRRYFDFQRRTGQLPLQKEVRQNLLQRQFNSACSCQHRTSMSIVFCLLMVSIGFVSQVSLFVFVLFLLCREKICHSRVENHEFPWLAILKCVCFWTGTSINLNLMVWLWTGGFGRLQECAAP